MAASPHDHDESAGKGIRTVQGVLADGSLVLLLFLAATLAPFEFSSVPRWIPAGWSWLDGGLNLGLGLLAGGLMSRRGTLRPVLWTGAVAGVCEVAQAWCFRQPAPTDALANVLGAWGGVVLARRARRPDVRAMRGLAALAIVGVPAALTLSVPMVGGAALTGGLEGGEDPGLLLSLGDEPTGLRPLVATLRDLEIAVEGDSGTRVLYQRDFRDARAGVTPGDHVVTPDGLRMTGGRWVAPPEFSEHLLANLPGAAGLRVVATIRRDLDQRAQGRVVTFSRDIHTRGFTLGLDGGAIQWRVSSAATGPDGMAPQLKTRREVLEAGRWHRVEARFGPRRSSVRVDGRAVEEVSLAIRRGPPPLGRGLGVFLWAFGVGLGLLGVPPRRGAVTALILGSAIAWLGPLEHLGVPARCVATILPALVALAASARRWY